MKLAKILGWALLPVSLLCAQTEQRQTLGIAPVETTPAVKQAAEKRGSLNQLERLAQGLDTQLTDTFGQTRKFQIVARTDLAPIFKEQGLSASGNLSPEEGAKLYQLTGAKYLLVVTLDDFQDRRELGNFELADMVVRRVTIRAGGVAKIYETATGKLVSSEAVSSDATDVERQFTESATSDPINDRLLSRTARALAEAVAAKTTDAVYPARVLAKTDKQITINRGENSGIAAGQIWILCAQGETLVDPDTKEVLGRQEVPVGKARVTSVLPKYAIAELIEDFGVQPLQIAYPQK